MNVLKQKELNQYIRVPLKLLGSHGIFIMLAIVFTMFFSWLIEKKHGPLIYSIFVSSIYALTIYTDMWEIGNKDSRPYTKEKPHILKGLVFGIIASAVTIILVVLFFISKAGYLDFKVLNLVYRLWMVPFIGFFEAFGENYPWIFIAVIFVLPLFSFLGYFAGMKRFYLRKDMRRAVKKAKDNTQTDK